MDGTPLGPSSEWGPVGRVLLGPAALTEPRVLRSIRSVVSMFAELCNRHYYLIPEPSITCKESLSPERSLPSRPCAGSGWTCHTQPESFFFPARPRLRAHLPAGEQLCGLRCVGAWPGHPMSSLPSLVRPAPTVSQQGPRDKGGDSCVLSGLGPRPLVPLQPSVLWDEDPGMGGGQKEHAGAPSRGTSAPWRKGKTRGTELCRPS